MSTVVARHVTISGRVQGVFFRDSLRRQAQARGVAGWARNTADGTVEAMLEGEPADVERVIDWCRSGPSRAEVDEVRVRERAPEGLNGFEIR
ncbi:MAG: acylphosphatase [Solirubrobacterales bacterium]|nr:acylphosphatase [Solirubrobacterales bacterium]